METPFFFDNDNYTLFGVLHEPDKNISAQSHANSSSKNIGLVFCYPFAEEKLLAYRVMVNLARSLSKKGIYCLRFDYMGHGDSSGNFEDATIETRISDIKRAISYFKERTNIQKVGVLGVRLGATLACLTNGSVNEADFLILISPIIDGSSYIDQCLRSNLTTQLSVFKKISKNRKQLVNDLQSGLHVNIDGYLLTNILYQEIQGINLLTNPISLPIHISLIQIFKNKHQSVDQNITDFIAKAHSLGKQVNFFNVIDHYFWTDTRKYIPHSKNILAVITNWLNEKII